HTHKGIHRNSHVRTHPYTHTSTRTHTHTHTHVQSSKRVIRLIQHCSHFLTQCKVNASYRTNHLSSYKMQKHTQANTCAHIHTHTHTLSLSHTHTHTLSLSHTHTDTHSHPQSLLPTNGNIPQGNATRFHSTPKVDVQYSFIK